MTGRHADRFPRSSAALAQYPTQLTELVRAGASDVQLEREGYTIFEVSAVRTLAGRIDATDYTLDRRSGRSAAGSNAGSKEVSSRT